MDALVFRTDDPSKWGTGKGSNLTPTDFDNNNWAVKTAVEALEAASSSAASIDHFETAGTSFYAHMSDGTTLGPYALPVITWNFTGAWVPSHAYAVGDVVTYANGAYVVKTAHTSGTTFDPAATDGSGHNLYGTIVELSAPVAQIGTVAGTSYTLTLSDAGKYLRFTSSSAVAITVPTNASVAVPIGTEYHMRQVGAGALTVAAASGVTLNVPTGYTAGTAIAGATMTVKKVAADEWDLMGLLAS